MCCFDARRMETCCSDMTGDVVVIYHTPLLPKEEPQIYDQSYFSDVLTANHRWKTVTSVSPVT